MSKRMGSKARKARKEAIAKRAEMVPVLQVVDKTGRVKQVAEPKAVRLPDFNVTLKRDRKTGEVVSVVQVERGRKAVNLGLGQASAMHDKAIQGRTHHATAWNAPSGEGRGSQTGSRGGMRWAGVKRDKIETFGNAPIAERTGPDTRRVQSTRLLMAKRKRNAEERWGMKYD